MNATGTTIRASVEARRVAVTVVGLSGAPWAQMLNRAGYAVSLEQCIEYARLEPSRLLVIAVEAPEPEAWDVVRHLRQRSSIPVLAVIDGLVDDRRWHLMSAGTDGCLDSACTVDEFLAAVDAVLASGTNTVPSEARIAHPANTRVHAPVDA